MCFSSPPARATAPQAQQDRRPVPVQRPKPPAPELGPEPTPSSAEPGSAENDETPLPADWAPELLDAMLSSPNSEGRDALLDAAFAAGPAVVPQLEAALKDDRTVEFAAQSLAYVGGPKALAILSKLVSDPRDLDLRRFYYGALGEFQVPEAAKVLFYALERADEEPDRTVTEAIAPERRPRRVTVCVRYVASVRSGSPIRRPASRTMRSTGSTWSSPSMTSIVSPGTSSSSSCARRPFSSIRPGST